MKRFDLFAILATLSAAAWMGCVGDDPAVGPGGTANDMDAQASGNPDARADDSAARTDGSATDASVSTGPCDPSKAWNAPVALAGFATTAMESSASLSPNELVLYFSGSGGALNDGTNGFDLFVASRASATMPFGAPKPIGAVNSQFGENDPSITADGLTLFFSLQSSNTRMWSSTRSTLLGDFMDPVSLDSIASPGSIAADGTPFVTADGTELWFSSTRVVTGALGGADLFVSARTGSTFAAPAPVAVLDSADNEEWPVLSSDGLTMYFATDRSGSGDFDIWMSRRGAKSSPFTKPVVVTELNSTSPDYPSWISPDNCRMYLTSTRSGNADILVAERQR